VLVFLNVGTVRCVPVAALWCLAELMAMTVSLKKDFCEGGDAAGRNERQAFLMRDDHSIEMVEGVTASVAR
jgi:hypothetical protein